MEKGCLKTVTEVQEFLSSFSLGKRNTLIDTVLVNGQPIKRFINEFWTAKQRQGSPLHEISYRACFKSQLPEFFITHLTQKGDIVYDPFAGRGTTVVEAGLLGREVISNDINPLSKLLAKPRLFIPDLEQIKDRLYSIPLNSSQKAEIDISMFYHPATESELISLKNYFIARMAEGQMDYIDNWIRMVATNRLTGHSTGFFSVYTLPPNQAVSPESQIKINKKKNQTPQRREVKQIILRKSKNLLQGITNEQKENLELIKDSAIFLEGDARDVNEITSNSVQLSVTSPPFLDIVQYSKDNWLRCWFNGIDAKLIEKRITMARTVDEWSNVMADVFKELYRIAKPGGWVAFEVGEVRKGKIKLDEIVVPLGLSAGFDCIGIIINQQEFTKTANIWGVDNNKSGTNTNRIVLFHKH